MTPRPVIHRTQLAFKGGVVAWRVQAGNVWYLCFTLEEVLRLVPLCQILKHPKLRAELAAMIGG